MLYVSCMYYICMYGTQERKLIPTTTAKKCKRSFLLILLFMLTFPVEAQAEKRKYQIRKEKVDAESEQSYVLLGPRSFPPGVFLLCSGLEKCARTLQQNYIGAVYSVCIILFSLQRIYFSLFLSLFHFVRFQWQHTGLACTVCSPLRCQMLE